MTAAVASLPIPRTRQGDLVLAGPVGSLEAYMQAVGQVPVLSQAEETALARRFRNDNDIDAARHPPPHEQPALAGMRDLMGRNACLH